MRACRCGFLVAAMTVGLTIGLAPPAFAEPPQNDSESAAVEVAAVPFAYTETTTEATADGPRFCSNNGSVFFSFTPGADIRTEVDTFGSDYDTVLGIYTRDGGVHPIDCNDDRYSSQSAVRFSASAGTTYFIMVGFCCGNGASGNGGQLTLHVSRVAKVPLQVDVTIATTGAASSATGIATVSGTATCTKPALFELYGNLRQIRNSIFLARTSFDRVLPCEPGDPAAWELQMDTDTSVVFGPGTALLTYQLAATDAFRDFIQQDQAAATIQLAST